MSTNVATPSLDDLSAALALLEVPEPILRSFREKPHVEMAWDFTDAICASSQAIVTDWRFHPSEPLREIFLRLYPAGIKAMIETENAETFLPTKLFLQIDGVGARYAVKIPNKPDLHEIVFAFRAILPDTVRIYALAAFDGTDTYGHLVAVKEIWQRLEELLGPWFAQIFCEQPGKGMFKKVGKDVKPKRDFLQKRMKGAREWLERMRTDFDARYQKDLDIVVKRLDSPHLMEHPGRETTAPQHQETQRQEWRAFVASPNRLMLVNYTSWGGRSGAEGLVDLWDRSPGGWTKIRRALEYYYWDVPFQLRFKKPRDHFFGCGDFGNKLALAIALQEWQTADYFCKQMLRVANFGVAGRPLSRFLLKLYSLRNPAIFDGVSEPDKSFGVYGTVLAAWNDPAKLGGALDVACDYHMMRTGDDHEFSWPPFGTFAAEIFAILRIRQELGLETPRIDHQLLDAPWRQLPDRVPLETDALLERLQQVARDDVPDLSTR